MKTKRQFAFLFAVIASIVSTAISADTGNCTSYRMSPCFNGGTCVDKQLNGFTCVCLPQFRGPQCKTRVGGCVSKPCVHGTCRDGVLPNRYTCVCQMGFTGRKCERKINPMNKPQAIKKDCPKLRRIKNVKVHIRKVKGRKLAIYLCKSGQIIGARLRVCHPSGKWSGSPPTCRVRVHVRCKSPRSRIRHGRVVTGNVFSNGAKVKYVCINGYELRPRGAVTRVCTNGRWIPDVQPHCRKAKKCKRLETPTNGRRLGNSRTAGSRVRFMCNTGFELIGKESLVCKRSGRWDSVIPKCGKKDPLMNLKRAANGLRRHFINKLELLTTDSRARSGLSSGAAGLDLVFVFDSSASVGNPNFRKGIAFARTIIDEFGISASPSGTRVAVLVFSDTARVIFNLQTNRIIDKEEAVRRLENLQFQGGGTATRLALQSVIDSVTPELRNNSKKALFLITDGKSNRAGSPEKAAKVLRVGFNFEIFAIGVSDNVHQGELKSIASEPFRTHVYLIKDYKTLAKLKELITSKGTDYDECGVAGDTQLRDLNDRLRIVGGREAKAGAWPWVAAIYVKNSFRCSGALISKNWVLTVAHCFFYDGQVKGSDVVVRLGEHDRTLEEGSEQNIRVSNIHLHPRARKTVLDYDIALIELTNTTKLTAYVRTLCLPQQTDTLLVRPHAYGVLAGWGSTQKVTVDGMSGPQYPVLKQVKLPFVSRRQCQTNHTHAITKRMRCAGDAMGQKDACKGDSGAPLVVKRPQRNWAVVGLTSWGEGCAQKGKYGVYADILNQGYLTWITATSGVAPAT